MLLSSPGSPEAPVRTGWAPRRVPATQALRTGRALLVVAVTVLVALVLAPAAQAHEGTDGEIAALLDRVTPEMPGVALIVETTALGPQFVLENATATELTVLSSVGDPLFRVGPEGVFGNIRSPEWYTSKTPDGAITVPERAAEKGVPVWLKVSRDPNWGWFDHRLHAVSLSPEQKAGTAPLEAFGTWTVPLQYGDALGSADGHFEYRPPLGTFTPTLSDTSPAPGVTLTALPGNPRPAVAIDNSGSSEVIVLGDVGEPYLRITAAGAEANGASPTWITSQNPAAQGEQAGDPTVPPRWVPVGTNPNYAFTLERAGPEQDLAALYRITEPAVVRSWSVSLLVNGTPVVVDGETTITPAGYEPSFWGSWAVPGGVVLLLAALIGGGVWVVHRRRAAATNRPNPRPAGKKERVGATP
ncbi:MAG: hypothetical protein ACRDRH_11835 [Pseudonocardia sp.]